MKESKFNFRLQDHTGMIIYNAKSDEVIALNPLLADIYEKETPDSIHDRHPELFSYLTEKGVLVEENTDEVADYIAHMEKVENEMKEFSITINPTLACNMKCWYCYEKHDTNTNMTQDVIHSIQNLISTKVTENDLKGLSIDFFGGEPLLNYKKAVLPILEHAYTECLNKNKNLYASFTTNGYLLSDEIYNQLLKYTKWGGHSIANHT